MELPIPNKLVKLWGVWNLQGCIILSLFLQALLVLFASLRKRSKNTFLLFLIWSAYLTADWVAAVAIGVIIKTQSSYAYSCQPPKGSNKDLIAFWASFLLLHLGGPDNITSFALEDNEFWLRHFLGLTLQVLAAAYSIYLALPTTKLWLTPTILVFVVGTIKYGERTYALFLASSDRFGAATDSSSMGDDDAAVSEIDDVKLLKSAYKQFEIFKRVFFGNCLSAEVRTFSRKIFLEIDDHKCAFRLLEYELSLLYEVLHTKVMVMRRRIGYLLRFSSLCFIIDAFILFFMIEKQGLRKFDVALTYSLLVGAVVLDLISITKLISSDWILVVLKEISWIKRYIINSTYILKRRRWSGSVSQYNMISYCLDERPTWGYKFARRIHVLGILDKLKIMYFSSSEMVSEDLKSLIFKELKRKSNVYAHNPADAVKECLRHGHSTLSVGKLDDDVKKLQWSVKEFQYAESLLLWHLATELLCSVDDGGHVHIINPHRRICKILSDYMFYLLAMKPTTLSPVLGNCGVAFRDTCAEAKRFFGKYKSNLVSHDHSKACEKIISVETKLRASAAKGSSKSKSVLFDACILAKQLRQLENRWEVMDGMWVELLS